MKFRPVVLVVFLFLTGLCADAQESAHNFSPLGAPAGAVPQTYKTVKTLGGTPNYMPVWTGANLVGNSVLYQSGLNVGIGTTSPSAMLDVNGAINAGTGYDLGGTLFAFGSFTNGNAFLGFAGDAVTSGIQSVAVGWQALKSDTSGNYNTATGASALYSNTTGSSNTAAGTNTLVFNSTGNYNTANGGSAMYSSTTGSDNVASGYFALFSNNTGNSNSAHGNYALYSNTNGNYNTALGYFADVGSGSLTNATAIGAYSYATQSNSLILGSINGVNRATSNTSVGIGTTAPTHILTIGQGFGHAIADGWDTYSSRRYKTNVRTISDALVKVQQLRGVSYDLKASGKHELGVIAEEVGAVVPEVVTFDKNGKDAQGVDYGRLTALLIEATKQQQGLIEKQQRQLRAQQMQISELASQLKTVEASVRTLRQGNSEVQHVSSVDSVRQ